MQKVEQKLLDAHRSILGEDRFNRIIRRAMKARSRPGTWNPCDLENLEEVLRQIVKTHGKAPIIGTRRQLMELFLKHEGEIPLTLLELAETAFPKGIWTGHYSKTKELNLSNRKGNA